MKPFLCKTRVLLDFEYFTQYVAAFIVSIGLVVEGMHYAWSSSAIPQLLDTNYPVKVTEDEAETITNMFTYGSLTYTLIGLADYPKLNQKAAVSLSAVVMVVSWVTLATARTAFQLQIARFLAGTGRSLVLQVSINYICEMADPKIRGTLVALVYVMMNFGLLVMYSVGPYLNIYYSAIFGAAFSVFELAFIKWVPESPYVLILRGKTSKARIVLKSLRKLWNVEDELDYITKCVEQENEENSSIWCLFTVKSNRKALLIMSALTGFQVLSGVNIQIREILKLSGGNSESFITATVAAAGSVIVCSFSGLFLDDLGRRIILMTSFAISGMTLGVLGFHIYLADQIPWNLEVFNNLSFFCLMVYTLAYKMGIGMIPLLLGGELFSINMKNIGSCICELLSCVFSFLSIYIMSIMYTELGYHTQFFIYSVFCFLGVSFTYFFVPETKCCSLGEIQNKLK